jgi:hypothetical protein
MKQKIIIKHKDVDQGLLDQIIKIKSVAWPYSYQKHLQWINDNITENDIHLVFIENNLALAYLNLIDTSIIINKNLAKVLGIGNVCTSTKMKGFGSIIMEFANSYLTEKNIPGILFCKEPLINFYRKFGWKTIDRNKIQIDFLPESSFILYYNIDFDISSIEYNGRYF